jgi:hypothetical protein
MEKIAEVRQEANGKRGENAGLWARMQGICANGTMRRGIVVLVLAAAAGLQYYLVNVPVADLSRTTKFSPAKVMAADQVVSFVNPETDPGHFAFSYDQPAESQGQRMLLSAYFDHGSLSDETVLQLAAIGVHAPAQADSISYLTHAERNGSCATSAHADASTNGGVTRSTEFTQKEVVSSDRYRLLELKTTGADTVVTLLSKGAFAANNLSACQVMLQVGNWQQGTGGFLPIKVRVPSGSSFRFRWEASEVQATGWPGSGPPRSLIEFGTSGRQSFSAAEARVISTQDANHASPNSGLFARSESAQAPLKIDAFRIGTDQLQFAASGRARVWEDGHVITTANLIDAINKYPLIAALFGGANLGLLNWAKKQLASRQRESAIPFPKEEEQPPPAAEEHRAAG